MYFMTIQGRTKISGAPVGEKRREEDDTQQEYYFKHLKRGNAAVIFGQTDNMLKTWKMNTRGGTGYESIPRMEQM